MGLGVRPSRETGEKGQRCISPDQEGDTRQGKHVKIKTATVTVVYFLAAAVLVSADVRLPNVIGHKMVLQQGKPVNIWGWADPGEKVTVEFGGRKKTTKTGKDGKWMVRLRKLKASRTPAIGTINTVTIPWVAKSRKSHSRTFPSV